MKKLFITLFCVGMAAPLFAEGTNQLADENSRVSYAIGLNIGHNFKRGGLDAENVDVDLVARAIKDVLNGRPEMMTEVEVSETMKKFSTEMKTRMQVKMKAAGELNKTQGEAFLTTNKLVSGLKLMSATTPTGQPAELQYLVIKEGTGPVPTATDKVSVNYRGTLLDGTEFDSSYKRGQPASFAVNRVIPGWTQALEKMPVGSKWKLFIPSELAYGEQGNQSIPPNSVLIFEVELLGIESTPPPQKSAAAPMAPSAALSSPIVAVQGTNVHVLTQEEVEKAQQQAQQQQQEKK
jgi:FKBP-type peptidyl-prolyl cis-trans isomerase FklB